MAATADLVDPVCEMRVRPASPHAVEHAEPVDMRTHRLSRAPVRNIRRNRFFAVASNTLRVSIAAAAMSFASVSATENALRSRRF